MHYHASCKKTETTFFCIPAQKFSLFLQTAWLLPGMEDYKDVVPPLSRDKIGELEEAFASFRAAWGQSFPTQTQYTCWPKMGPFFTVVVAEGKASLSFISFLTQILELTETTNQSQSVFIEKGRYSSISLFCFHTTVRGICIVPFPTITKSCCKMNLRGSKSSPMDIRTITCAPPYQGLH